MAPLLDPSASSSAGDLQGRAAARWRWAPLACLSALVTVGTVFQARGGLFIDVPEQVISATRRGAEASVASGVLGRALAVNNAEGGTIEKDTAEQVTTFEDVAPTNVQQTDVVVTTTPNGAFAPITDAVMPPEPTPTTAVMEEVNTEAAEAPEPTPTAAVMVEVNTEAAEVSAEELTAEKGNAEEVTAEKGNAEEVTSRRLVMLGLVAMATACGLALARYLRGSRPNKNHDDGAKDDQVLAAKSRPRPKFSESSGRVRPLIELQKPGQ